MAPKAKCEALEQLRSEATGAVCEAKKTRRSRDVSIKEDAELSSEVQRRMHALIKHLLVGHDGLPCPAGDRPIVSPEMPSATTEKPTGLFPELLEAGES